MKQVIILLFMVIGCNLFAQSVQDTIDNTTIVDYAIDKNTLVTTVTRGDGVQVITRQPFASKKNLNDYIAMLKEEAKKDVEGGKQQLKERLEQMRKQRVDMIKAYDAEIDKVQQEIKNVNTAARLNKEGLAKLNKL